MGFCIKFIKEGGTVEFTNCSQECIDNMLRLKGENSSNLNRGSPSGKNYTDGIYWGGPYQREVWKVPDNVRVEITCNDDCSIAKISVCTNIAGRWLGHELKVFNPGDPLPDSGWPANNW